VEWEEWHCLAWRDWHDREWDVTDSLHTFQPSLTLGGHLAESTPVMAVPQNHRIGPRRVAAWRRRPCDPALHDQKTAPFGEAAPQRGASRSRWRATERPSPACSHYKAWFPTQAQPRAGRFKRWPRCRNIRPSRWRPSAGLWARSTVRVRLLAPRSGPRSGASMADPHRRARRAQTP